MNKMFLSIILPVFNSEDSLRGSLTSIFDQSNTNFELICIDDCSSDKSYETLKVSRRKHPTMKVIQNNMHIGTFASMRKAAKVAKSNYIIFVNPADSIFPGMVDTLAKKIKQYQYPDLIRFGVNQLENEQQCYYPRLNNYSNYDKVMTGSEALINWTINNPSIDEDCSKFFMYCFKTKIFKNLPIFKNAGKYEDFMLLPYIILKAKSILNISDVCYCREKSDYSKYLSNQSLLAVRVSEETNALQTALENVKYFDNLDTKKKLLLKKSYFTLHNKKMVSLVKLSAAISKQLTLANK